MLLKVKKVLQKEYATTFIDMQILIINSWKITIEIKNLHLQYLDVNNLLVGQCYKSFQSIILNGSKILHKWIKDKIKDQT